jgi:hypothetical protein
LNEKLPAWAADALAISIAAITMNFFTTRLPTTG